MTVSRWIPESRSVPRIEFPSTSRLTTRRTFSRDRYIPPTDQRVSEHVLWQMGQKKRRVPLRLRPCFQHVAAHCGHCIGGVILNV